MRILYYNAFAGISGDMNLSAMLDLGVPKDALINELKKLNLDFWHIETYQDSRGGIFGTRLEVILEDECSSHHNEHEHLHEHSHSDCHHHHEHHHAPSEHTSHHAHRSFADIKKIILESGLSEKVKTLSLKIFEKIAQAEAKVHNKEIDEVHFHEVGALDSIIDIVGAAICVDLLGVDIFYCSKIELGGGTVKCAHGIMHVPAPATSEILKDIPVSLNASPFECTTPTGAAILATLCSKFDQTISGKILKNGIGIGKRNPPQIPNLLKVSLIETEENPDLHQEEMFVLETNIDDMSPEEISFACEKLFEKNAKDVWQESIFMKKNRLAMKLCALAKKEDLKEITNVILTHTTSLGVRCTKTNRISIERKILEANTSLGTVKFKLATFANQKKFKAEFDDRKKIANEKNLTLQEVEKILGNEFEA